MIKIIVENLTIEGIHFEGEEPADFLKLQDNAPYTVASPVKYSFTASIVASDVLVRGSISTTIAGECGRCLKKSELEVVNNDLCLHIEKPGQGELDISEELLEEISIDLPSNILCSEKCKGLCPSCGQNLNSNTCNCTLDTIEEENIWGELDNLEIDNN